MARNRVKASAPYSLVAGKAKKGLMAQHMAVPSAAKRAKVTLKEWYSQGD